jgi:3,4-dihydroxy 2-butanone 4-phosphate synthase/GTP cyclohydrolase II
MSRNIGAVLDPVEVAITAIAEGRPVVVVDDEDRENEGDLIVAASMATPEVIGFMVRHTSGVICAPMQGADLDRLSLPPMTQVNQDPKGTAYTVSVDAAAGVTTGISAADRSRTVTTLASPDARAADFTRPGHVFPLRAVDGGVLRRPGHTEAAIDLARLAGLRPAGALAELVHDDGSMMRLPALREFADEHGLALVSIADLIRHRRRHERQVEAVATTRLPTAHGVFAAHAYRDLVDGREHVALVMGDVSSDEPVLTRLHSECLTGDALGSLRCDCGTQLQAALAAVASAGRGVVVYLRGHEGRGIGLAHKLRAYALQDDGRDTVDANLELGLPADSRDYGTGAQILADLGAKKLALITNNPAKLSGIEGYGMTVTERVPLPTAVHAENVRYLRTKRDRLGHQLDDLSL